MKKLIATISIFAASITLGLSQTGTTNHWVIKITPQTTKAQLDSMTVALKNVNIYLTITKAEYVSGKLTKLQGSINVNSEKGTPSGSFKSDNLSSYEITVDNNPAKLMIKGK